MGVNMIELITDKMFELITSKGFESLSQLKQQYNNQTILYGIIKRFGEGEYFKNEFRNTLYCDNKDIVLQIPEATISPVLNVQEISDNLYESMTHLFIGKPEDVKKITEVLATEYLSKRELTIKLLELAIAEKNSTDQILQDIGKTRDIVEKVNEYNEKTEYRKQEILKRGLGRKMDSFISVAAGSYLQWVNKGNIVTKGNNVPETLQYMAQIKEMISTGFPKITEDFHKISVCVARTDKFPFECQEISSLDYIIYIRTILEQRADELLRLSNYLPDNFIYLLFELLDLFERNPLYNLNNKEIAKIIITAKPATGTNLRQSIVNELENLGQVILKFEPLFHAYLK